VFSQHLQRVWLVGADDQVVRTYLVSGSRTHNLQPGTYAIEHRERHAIGIADSGMMEYFDIFTSGPTGAAIGFHSIPVKDGHLVQTRAQLGTPQSHGCIRQWQPDAIALWKFAPLGTKVVVVA
jgi:lipoprotein-anchoring transpeptidase ErfK/SrfK